MSRHRVEEGQDIIDSRDVLARIEELTEELTPPEIECTCADERDDDDRPKVPLTATCGTCGFSWCERCEPCPSARTPCEYQHDEDAREELAKLRALADECEGYGDWKYGETLIADHYFETYARDLAEDIGAVGKDLPWPACHIDWDAACDALKQDYMSVEYGSTTYWMRV